MIPEPIQLIVLAFEMLRRELPDGEVKDAVYRTQEKMMVIFQEEFNA